MTPKLLLRIASGCLLFFAIGHSIGHFTRHSNADPKAQEVLKIMQENKFNMFGQMRTFDENYTGMSLNLIFTLLAFVLIVWSLSGDDSINNRLKSKILIPVGVCCVGFAITGFLYFFPVPAVNSLIAAALILYSSILVRRT